MPATPESKHGRKGLPISVNISILVSIAIIVSAVAGVYLYSWRSSRLYNEEVINDVEMLADTLTPQLVDALAIEDNQAVERIMREATGANMQVADALILNASGSEILYDIYGEREGGKFTEDLKKPEAIYFHTPITMKTGMVYGEYFEDQELGQLVLGVEKKDYLMNERLRAVVSFSQRVSKNISESVAARDFLKVREIIGNMVGDRNNIRYTQLLHLDGTILFCSSTEMTDKEARELEGEVEKSKIGRRSLEVSTRKPLLIQNTRDESGGLLLDIAAPVMKGDEKIAVVRVGYSMSEFMAAQRRTKTLVFLIAAGLTVIGLLIALGTVMRISRPIQLLAAAAKRIGAGELNQVIEIKTGGRETRELGESFNDMIVGLKERDFVKDTLGRYVSKKVADELLANPDMIAPGGRKQEVTILFSDIRGFTTFSEGRPPEDVVSHLNEYMSAMVEVIGRNEGVVDKFIGDAIMAVFGSPIVHEDDTLRAVKTAVEMMYGLIELNMKWAAEGKPTFKIGIGINTGEVIVGNIGDESKMEYTVIGDNVNIASRIEDLTKQYKCPIIISGSTYEKVKDLVDAERLEDVFVKGKTHAVRIYSLKGLKEDSGQQ